MGDVMKILDAQVHVWVPQSPERPWPQGGAARAQLPHALDCSKLLAMMNEAGVDGAVLVPPSWEGDGNDHALAGAAAHPDRFAVMGRLALDQPNNARLLPDWKRQAGMLGVRLTFVQEREREWLRNGTTDWFWPAAEAAGVPVMLHATGLMGHVQAIAERHPGLTIIIDHFGLSTRMVNEGRAEQCIDDIVSLAKLPNVYAKVTAAPVYSRQPYPFRDMDRHIERVVRAFGPRRCFWGTDLSHALERASYRQCVTHFTQELKFLSDEDKEWIKGRSLVECLGWAL
jgi:predicted TIM-barrel fold metal-dependent hydrolase